MIIGRQYIFQTGFMAFLLILFFFNVGSVYSAPGMAVEPSVLDKIESEGQAGFMIFFGEKPDLSRAHALGWKKQGEFVVDSLQSASIRAQARVREYLDGHNVKYKAFWVDNVIIVETSGKAVLEGLFDFSEIESIKSRRIMQLHEPIILGGVRVAPMAVGANISHIQANSAWALGYTGAGIVVANIDTGVRYTHEALVGQYRGNLGGGSYNHNYNWWDPSSVCGVPSTTPCDNNGHGTHTMGTIVGDDTGHTNQIGVAPGAKWIACKGCESNSCSDSALLGCAQFILAPTDLTGANPDPSLRPHVVNNSWGGGSGDLWYQTSVNNWHAAGIYPVFSAGNNGPGCSTAGSPGDYGNVTAVGAVSHTDNLPASFSSRGPGAFDDDVNGSAGLLRLKPQVSAPGVNICSSIPTSDASYSCGYSGTSMAAPHVAGLVALMWNAAPCLARNYSTTETIIQNTATGLVDGSSCGGDPTGIPNHTMGYGLINALAAVQIAVAQCGGTGTLQGIVTDANTGLGISNAAVQAGGYSVTTGSDGRYAVVVPANTYDITASADGYATDTVLGVVVADGGTTTQGFDLGAGRLEMDVPFIDVAIPINSVTTRNFNISNSGSVGAEFYLRESSRTVAAVTTVPRNESPIVRNLEPTSVGKAPTTSFAAQELRTRTKAVLAGVTAYAVDLLQSQLGSFDTETPGVWSMIGGVGSDSYFAGDFLGDDFTKIYAISNDTNQFVTLDIATASITPIGTSSPNPGESWTGLTSTDDGILYGSSTTCSSSTLYSIDPSNGAATPIGPITNAPCIIDIAVNASGEMYGVDIINDNLLSIDPATGEGTVVGSIGFDANYAQGMGFDKASGVLYLAAYNNSEGRGELRIADTTTGNTILVGAFSNNSELDCLAFPSTGTVEWLSESPITGTVAAGFSSPVDVTFNSTGMSLGVYGGQLNVESNTPYGTSRIPLTLYVVSDSAKQYKLTAKKKRVNNGDGIIQSSDGMINCGDTCKVKYYQGPRVSLSASAYPGSTFVGWLPTSLNCAGTGPCTVAMSKSKKAQAVFVGDYSLTVLKKGNGTGRVSSSDDRIDCGATCSAKYPVYTSTTLTASPDPGMEFMKWSPSSLCPGTGPCEVTFDKAKKVTAFFEIQDSSTSAISSYNRQ